MTAAAKSRLLTVPELADRPPVVRREISDPARHHKLVSLLADLVAAHRASGGR